MLKRQETIFNGMALSLVGHSVPYHSMLEFLNVVLSVFGNFHTTWNKLYVVFICCNISNKALIKWILGLFV